MHSVQPLELAAAAPVPPTGRVLWPEAGRLLLHRWVPFVIIGASRALAAFHHWQGSPWGSTEGRRAVLGCWRGRQAACPAGGRDGRHWQPGYADSCPPTPHPRQHAPTTRARPPTAPQSTAGCRATARATRARPSLWATSRAPRCAALGLHGRGWLQVAGRLQGAVVGDVSLVCTASRSAQVRCIPAVPNDRNSTPAVPLTLCSRPSCFAPPLS